VTAGGEQPDVVDPQCVPEGHACVAFLEFDDMGEAWDRRQLTEALALIERAKTLERPPVVVLFVHGWKNNASREPNRRNGNVNGFEGVLEHLRTNIYSGFPVVGIYVGWRGDLIPTYWPVRRQFSYFNREDTAIRIPGASMTNALVEIAAVTHRQREDAYLLMVGHSFGALVLERALAQAMADYALRIASDVPANRQDGGWADLVVFLNSAAAATEGKQMLDLLKNRTVFVSTDPQGIEHRRPLYLSISSLGDAATRFAMPIGHGPSFLNFKTNRSFRAYSSADGSQPPVTSQNAYYMSTLAHMQAVQSHLIVEDEACSQAAAAPTSIGPPFTLPNGRTYQVCERPARWNDTPYWAMQMPASIVRDHSSIFTEDLVGLLNVFMVSGEEMSGSRRRRPVLMPAISPPRVAAGEMVTIRGTRFGSAQGAVTLDDRGLSATDVVSWSDGIVRIRVPAEMPPGEHRVVIRATDGYEQLFPRGSLKVEPPND
jgi:hypothetical protein